MARKIDTSHVVKLDDTNYQRWKLQVSLVLKASEVWTVVDGTAPRPDDTKAVEQKAWDLKDIQAQALIVPLLDKKETNHIYNCGSSHDIWKKLESIHSDVSSLNKQHTLAKFFNFKIGNNKPIIEAYSEIEELARCLNEMGIKMDETAVVTKIVSSLPDDKFHAFKKAWDSVAETSQTMPMLLGRLRKEELESKQNEDKRETNSQANINAYATKFGNNGGQKFQKKGKTHIDDLKKKTKCHNCGRVGHWCRECRAPKKDVQQDRNHKREEHNQIHEVQEEREMGSNFNSFKSKQDRTHAFMVYEKSQEIPSDLWISDSGADQHVTGRKDWFSIYEEFETPRKVSVTDNHEVLALGFGTIKLEGFIVGEWRSCTLEEVLYIPNAVNLFSECVAARKGHVIVRDHKQTVFYKDGKEGIRADYKNGLYFMKFRYLNNYHTFSTRTAKLWHERLSHINMGYLRATIQKNAATGIKLDELKQEFDCHNCLVGKSTRKPFPRVERSNQVKPGEVIHSDLSGKMPVASLGGAQYFLLLKDEATGFRSVYFLKHKNEAEAKIKQFVPFMKTQTGNKMKIFMSDNGTEFVNAGLSQFFSKLGIIHQTTAPFCPESNGQAEREMRTLKDTARAMMWTSQCPEYLWAEAVACTVYVHNRILNKQSQELTAYERIFKKKPDLTHVRVFGCQAYVHIPKEKRRVWDPKAKPSYLVGYDCNSKKYRIYDADTKSIITARNVSFIEQEFVTETKEEIETFYDTTYGGFYSDSEEADDMEITSEEKEKKPEEELVIQIGDFETAIPTEGETTVIIPRKLRDRSKINVPTKYQANHAMLIKEPRTYSEAVSSKQKPLWIQAMNDEIQSLTEKRTFLIVPKPPATKVLDGRWLFKIKRYADGSLERYKARFVVKGYKQEYGLDYGETFAPVCRYESIRLLLAIAAAKGLIIKQFDVNTAFLNGDLEEDIYMSQPEGYTDGNPSNVWLLKKSLYGLKQAPRCWSKKINSFLKTLGFSISKSDPSVFIAEYNHEMIYLILYVDDGLAISSNGNLVEELLNRIGKKFEIKVTPLSSLSIQISQSKNTGIIALGQQTSIENLLLKFNMQDCKETSVPMQPNLKLIPAENSDESLPYRELIGSILFIARTTRRDIAFAVNKMAQFTSGYTSTHWLCGKGILRYLKGTMGMEIQYRPNSKILLRGYTDSDYAGSQHDRKSTTGFIYMLNEAPVSWLSQKQPVVAVSSTEAEYVALAAGAKEAVWIRQFMTELGIQQHDPTDLFVDNTSAIKLAQNPEFHQRSKHIDVRFHFTRSLIEQEEIQVSYVSTLEQAADILTKPLQKTKQAEMRNLIGLKNKDIQGGKPEEYTERTRRSLFTSSWYWPVALMYLIGLLCVPGEGITQNAQPVLWRGSKTPITTGSQRVFLRIKLMDPCELLTSDILHTDVSKLAQIRCKEMYKEHFLNEMTQMCPIDHGYEIIHTRAKRFVIMMSIIIISSVILWAGAGTAFGLSIYNKGSISDLQEISKLQTVQIQNLEHRLNITEHAIRRMQTDFNSLLDEFERHGKDYTELKDKQVGTNLIISYITSRFVVAKQVIREANRQWKDGKLYPGFMDFLNYTLPCGDECLIRLATVKKCSFHSDLKDLYMTFDVPVINLELKLVVADPFKLMLQTENQTCVVKYTGPINAIVSNKDGCAYASNLKTLAPHDQVITPSGPCERISSESRTRYFGVERCDAKQLNDENDFIQIKPQHGMNYIYCPKSFITIGNKREPCPEDVLVLPITATFKINDFELK